MPQKNKLIITKTDLLKLERAKRRKLDIQFGVGVFATKVHKSKRHYNRQIEKKVLF